MSAPESQPEGGGWGDRLAEFPLRHYKLTLLLALLGTMTFSGLARRRRRASR